MPKDKPREKERKDIWFNKLDQARILAIAGEMTKQGINPFGRYNEVNPSKVIRWCLEQECKRLEIPPIS